MISHDSVEITTCIHSLPNGIHSQMLHIWNIYLYLPIFTPKNSSNVGKYSIWLVVWNIFFQFGIIIPTEYYFSEVLKPPTSYAWSIWDWFFTLCRC